MRQDRHAFGHSRQPRRESPAPDESQDIPRRICRTDGPCRRALATAGQPCRSPRTQPGSVSSEPTPEDSVDGAGMEIDTSYLRAIRRIGASMFIRHVEFQAVGASNSDTRGFILFIVRRWPELAGWCRMPDLCTNSAPEHPVFPLFDWRMPPLLQALPATAVPHRLFNGETSS